MPAIYDRQAVINQAMKYLDENGNVLTVQRAAIAGATSGNNEIVAATAGKTIRVLSLYLKAGAAGDVYFTSAAGGDVIFGGSTNKIKLAANDEINLQHNPHGWFETTTANQNLNMNASSTGPWAGGLTYVLIG